MSTMFPALQRVLRNECSPVTFFFRDDDAGWADDKLLALCDRFEGNAPLDLAVIPTAISDDLAQKLRAHPARLAFHQHGYRHHNHQPAGKKCEFADERGRQPLADDLRRGRERMLALFGERLDPIFTPPWNRCGALTAQLLPSIGVDVLSRDRRATPLEHDLTEVPVAVDWQRYRDDLDDAIVVRVRDALGPVGVMLHHAVMAEADTRLLGSLLELLAGHPMVRLVHMADAARVGVHR